MRKIVKSKYTGDYYRGRRQRSNGDYQYYGKIKSGRPRSRSINDGWRYQDRSLRVFRNQSPGSGKLRDRSYSRSKSRDGLRKKLEDISDQLTNKNESNTKLIELMKTLGDIGDKLPEGSSSDNVVTDIVEVISQPIETFNIEVQKTTSKFKIDTGAPKTLAGRLWIQQYCEDYGIDFNKLEKIKSNDIFILGNDKYPSLGQVEIPVDLVTVDGEDIQLKMKSHMITKPIELLTGMNTLKKWRAVLDTEILRY